MLRLLASRDEQSHYQRAVPFVQVTAELFCQWDACYHPRTMPWFQEAHSAAELAALDTFQRVVARILSELPEPLPPIEDFITTPQWERLASAAAAALAVIQSAETPS